MNVIWYISDLFACGHVRGEIIAREINKKFSNITVVCKRTPMFSDVFAADVMLFQRPTKEDSLMVMERAQRHGVKAVVEIDDDVFHVPKDFEAPYKFYGKKKVREIVATAIENADAITTTTRPLADALSAKVKGRKWFVIDNAVDVEHWEEAYTERQSRDRAWVTLGWMASGSHKIDAPLVVNVMKRLMKEHKNLRLHLIGWVGFKEMGKWIDKYKKRVVAEQWIKYELLPMCMRDMDIGISPLVDNAFNRAKSSLKVWQYAALGVPSVVSPLDPYNEAIEDGKNGMFAVGNSEESWYDCLKQLILDAEMRERMGAEARKTLLAEHDLRQTAIQWVDVFRTIKEL
jgi:glycosyltransferase involved in cell wall biosynthesis